MYIHLVFVKLKCPSFSIKMLTIFMVCTYFFHYTIFFVLYVYGFNLAFKAGKSSGKCYGF